MNIESILFPYPKKMVMTGGSCTIDWRTSILLPLDAGSITHTAAQTLREAVFSRFTYKLAILFSPDSGKTHNIRFELSDMYDNMEEYKLVVSEREIILTAAGEPGLFYAAATLIKLLNGYGTEMPCLEIYDSPDFENRGFMLDISRGRVPKLSYLKEFADFLAFNRINQLQLYVENSVRIAPYGEILMEGDALEPEEMISFDRYCADRGIELVPCVSTFGHLYDLLRMPTYSHLSEMPVGTGEPYTWFHRMRYHILDVSNPESLKLVCSILDALLPLFRSRKVNICCDETFDLGQGKNAEVIKERGYTDLYCSHVNAVAAYLKKQNREVMIWGDIVHSHPECCDHLDKDIICLNWHYYRNAGDARVKLFAENGFGQYVCPSVSGFGRIASSIDMSFENMRDLAQLGKKYGALGYLNTEWGDNGHLNMYWPDAPGIVYGAGIAWNTEDGRTVAELAKPISLMAFGDGQGEVLPLLHELSAQDLVIANELFIYHDWKVYGLPYETLGVNLYENAKKVMIEADPAALHKAAIRSEELARRLANLSAIDPLHKRELVLSARGVSLFQALVLLIKKKEYGQELEVLWNGKQLSERLKDWLREYTQAWRETCKESELYRIRTFFFNILNIIYKWADL